MRSRGSTRSFIRHAVARSTLEELTRPSHGGRVPPPPRGDLRTPFTISNLTAISVETAAHSRECPDQASAVRTFMTPIWPFCMKK